MKEEGSIPLFPRVATKLMHTGQTQAGHAQEGHAQNYLVQVGNTEPSNARSGFAQAGAQAGHVQAGHAQRSLATIDIDNTNLVIWINVNRPAICLCSSLPRRTHPTGESLFSLAGVPELRGSGGFIFTPTLFS